MEQLALQQQIEILQAQQQQIIAHQQQQFAQAGLIPPGLPHGMMPNNQGLMPPPPPPPGYISAPYQYQQPPPPQAQPQHSNHHGHQHRRGHSNAGSQSNINSGGQAERNNSAGHARRHSLALSEAKKAAAIAQAKRLLNPEDASTSQSSSSGEAIAGTNSPPGHTGGGSSGSTPTSSATPSFKFPSSPDRSESAVYRPPQNRLGVNQNNNDSGSRGGSSRHGTTGSGSFQFPPPDSDQIGSSHDRKGSNFAPQNHHQRTGSRNFDQNWRQNAQPMPPPQVPQNNDFLSPQQSFVPGHRSRGSYNSSISSISGYQNFNNGGGNQQRKSLFVPYLPQANLPGLLAEGRLVAGVLRVNRKNRSDAYVSTDGLLDADIFICGSKDRNRALEGDLVAVELLEVDEVWSSKREKEEKKKKRDHHASMSTSSISVEDNKSDATTLGSGAELGRRGSLKQRPTQKKNDDVEVEGQSLLLVEEEELSDQIKPLYAGHVVAVIERIPGQMFSGSLGLLRPSSQATKDKQSKEKGESGDSRPAERPKIVWFKPTDKRVPLIAIPTEQAPKDFVENHENYSNKVFVASIKRWPITSLHPFGTLVEELGPVNDLNIEIESILRDNNFVTGQFPETVLKVLPEAAENGEIATAAKNLGDNRFDYSNEFSLSFLTGGDMKVSDETFHVKKLPSGNLEVGIHVLDVTHYFSSSSPVDRETRKRANSVFLKQKAIHMLPEGLSEFLTFSPKKTSPSISVVFEIDTKTWETTDFKTELGLVKPSFSVGLGDVQKVLDNGEVTLPDQVVDTIKTLHLVASNFRKQRLQLDDSLSESSRLLGLLDIIEDEPIELDSISIFDTSTAKNFLDEINMKTNAAVAQKVYAVLGDKALLRRQADPILSRLESFAETLRLLNIPFDEVSSAGFQRALLSIQDDDSRRGLEALFFKCLSRAKYFLPGKVESDSHGHYLLNMPLYTHFTSPLRRYADLIVHRQLKHVLAEAEYQEDLATLSSSVDYCNFKKDSVRNAQEQSIHLFLCQVLAKLAEQSGGQIIRDGIVIQVYESAFDVLIPEFGIEKRVHGDQLPLVKAEFRKKDRTLELFWEAGVDSATFIPEDEKGATNGRASTLDTAISQSMSKLSLEEVSEHVASLSQQEGYKLAPSEPAEVHVPDIKNKSAVLKKYLEDVITRQEGNNNIQEIKMLRHVPVIIKAELDKNIPCITIRTVNPFS